MLMVTVVCMKWGSQFSAWHVNALFAGVLRHMEEVFDFVCLTDDARGLAQTIDARAIPEFGLPERAWTHGCWPKLAVFAPDLFPSDEIVLFLDLDVIVHNSLAPFIDLIRKRRHLVTQREWNPDLWSLLPPEFRPDRGVQSSVFGFRPMDVAHLHADFIANADQSLQTFRNDQQYLTQAVKRRSYWPASFCVSFKRACVRLFPLSLVLREIRQPVRAKIVVFHGKPRPWDTFVLDGIRWGPRWRFGTGPVPWIKEYFDQGDALLQSTHARFRGQSESVIR
jgi:hypothetical protein